MIGTAVKAYIDGDGNGIEAGTITLTADDASAITVFTGAASIAGSFGGVGVSLAIAVAIANNEVSNDVQAYIANADTGIATTGAISLSAVSGGPAFTTDAVTSGQLDAASDATMAALRSAFATNGVALHSGALSLSTLKAGAAWQLTAADSATYQIVVDGEVLRVTRPRSARPPPPRPPPPRSPPASPRA